MRTARRPLTDLGKELRKFRVDQSLTLTEMAEQLGISAALLSGIETGDRPASRQFIPWLLCAYPELKPREAELCRLAEATIVEVRIKLSELNNKANEFALEVARNFATLTDEQIDACMQILRRRPVSKV